MSNADTTGFGKFVPGFDFLQNLAQGAAGNNATLPNFGKWVAPTLDVEELEKRIEELKIVRFWLEQNSNALGATIQALEVQKMTLATLKGMNFSFGEAAATTASAAKPQASASPFAAASAAAAAAKEAAKEEAAKSTTDDEAKPKPSMIDPMQMWGSLTQQFQKIAESAVKEASGVAAQATKAAAASAEKVVAASRPATRTATRTSSRTTSRTSARKPAGKTGKSK